MFRQEFVLGMVPGRADSLRKPSLRSSSRIRRTRFRKPPLGGLGRASGDKPSMVVTGEGQHLCLDKGYDYAEPRRLAAERGFTLHLRTRGEEATAKRRRGAKARRWVVEAAHSWTNRFRDLQIRWCKKPENYLALIHFAFGIIAYRQCLPG